MVASKKARLAAIRQQIAKLGRKHELELASLLKEEAELKRMPRARTPRGERTPRRRQARAVVLLWDSHGQERWSQPPAAEAVVAKWAHLKFSVVPGAAELEELRRQASSMEGTGFVLGLWSKGEWKITASRKDGDRMRYTLRVFAEREADLPAALGQPVKKARPGC